MQKIELINKEMNIIFAYSEEDNFEKYVLKILSVYTVGFKENYSNLLLSIDPGIKHIGFIVFLDDYYLISQTFLEKQELLKKMEDIINYIQADNHELIKIDIKIGKMVLPGINELLNEIFSLCEAMTNCSIYLVDETKSSKIKIRLNKKKFPKHEASALILALREGIEVDKSNYLQVIKYTKPMGIRNQNIKENSDTDNEYMSSLRQAAERILKGELSLTESMKLIKN